MICLSHFPCSGIGWCIRRRSSSLMSRSFARMRSRRKADGRSRDLPVPAQGTSAHARVLDHAESDGRSQYHARSYCLPISKHRRHPGSERFRGSMAGLCAPLPTLRPRPRERVRTARGRCGLLLLHRSGLAPPYSLPVSRRTHSRSSLRSIHDVYIARLLTVTFTTTAFQTAAAYGCLKPAPTSRLRRAHLHLRHSTVSSDTFLTQNARAP